MRVERLQRRRRRHYRLYGLTVSCETPFPELEPVRARAPGAQSDIHVELSSGRLQGSPRAATSCLLLSLPTGEPWLSCEKVSDGFRVRFPKLAEFSVDAGGRRIRGRAAANTSSDTLRHLLLDQVLPLILSLHGGHALHATAVQTPLGVIAFTGSSGTGKSTLATSFLFAGYPVLSDDCLALRITKDQIVAIPAYPGLRLWEDTFRWLGCDGLPWRPVAHYTSKRRLLTPGPPVRFPCDRQPLARIYRLSRTPRAALWKEPDDVLIKPLPQRESFFHLLSSTFRLDLTDPMSSIRDFHFIGQLASRLPLRHLRIPDGVASLPAVRDAILADLTQP